MNNINPMGISGRIAALFQSAPITPLLALMALLLGGFAVLVTPREEEPQIDVTMANVLVSNLLARGRFWIVVWALGVAGAYLSTLAVIRPYLMGLEPSAVFRMVPQLIGGYSLLLLAIAALLTWGPGSKPRTT
jgi:hypothetical protein